MKQGMGEETRREKDATTLRHSTLLSHSPRRTDDDGSNKSIRENKHTGGDTTTSDTTLACTTTVALLPSSPSPPSALLSPVSSLLSSLSLSPLLSPSDLLCLSVSQVHRRLTDLSAQLLPLRKDTLRRGRELRRAAEQILNEVRRARQLHEQARGMRLKERARESPSSPSSPSSLLSPPLPSSSSFVSRQHWRCRRLLYSWARFSGTSLGILTRTAAEEGGEDDGEEEEECEEEDAAAADASVAAAPCSPSSSPVARSSLLSLPLSALHLSLQLLLDFLPHKQKKYRSIRKELRECIRWYERESEKEQAESLQGGDNNNEENAAATATAAADTADPTPLPLSSLPAAQKELFLCELDDDRRDSSDSTPPPPLPSHSILLTPPSDRHSESHLACCSANNSPQNNNDKEQFTPMSASSLSSATHFSSPLASSHHHSHSPHSPHPRPPLDAHHLRAPLPLDSSLPSSVLSSLSSLSSSSSSSSRSHPSHALIIYAQALQLLEREGIDIHNVEVEGEEEEDEEEEEDSEGEEEEEEDEGVAIDHSRLLSPASSSSSFSLHSSPALVHPTRSMQLCHVEHREEEEEEEAEAPLQHQHISFVSTTDSPSTAAAAHPFISQQYTAQISPLLPPSSSSSSSSSAADDHDHDHQPGTALSDSEERRAENQSAAVVAADEATQLPHTHCALSSHTQPQLLSLHVHAVGFCSFNRSVCRDLARTLALMMQRRFDAIKDKTEEQKKESNERSPAVRIEIVAAAEEDDEEDDAAQEKPSFHSPSIGDVKLIPLHLLVLDATQRLDVDALVHTLNRIQRTQRRRAGREELVKEMEKEEEEGARRCFIVWLHPSTSSVPFSPPSSPSSSSSSLPPHLFSSLRPFTCRHPWLDSLVSRGALSSLLVHLDSEDAATRIDEQREKLERQQEETKDNPTQRFLSPQQPIRQHAAQLQRLHALSTQLIAACAEQE